MYPVRVKYPLIVPKYPLSVNQLSLVGGPFGYRGAPLHGGGKGACFMVRVVDWPQSCCL